MPQAPRPITSGWKVRDGKHAAEGKLFRPPITWDGMVFVPTSDDIPLGWGGIVHCREGKGQGADGMGWQNMVSCDGMGW